MDAFGEYSTVMMERDVSGKVALVAGATGIIGRGVLNALAGAPGWRVRGLSRSPVPGVEALSVDLQSPRAVEGLQAAGDTTHVFYAAYSAQPDLQAEVAVNGPMLEHLLEGLNEAGAPLERVVLYQGAKVYGVHLGRVQAPFYEDETPRHLQPNFYYTQEDMLRRRASEGGFSWTLLRPDVVVGDAVGYPMSIALVIGAYAALSKATGTPLRFPGPEEVYESVFAQVTDSQLLGRASLWAATADAASNQAFNYVHAPFRWKRVFQRVAESLDMELGPPMPMTLARHMAFQGEVWAELARTHGLVDTPFEKLVGWGFGDFVFNTRFDMVSDMTKLHRAGFAETTDGAEAVVAAIGRLRARKVLP
jgi:nucleoside-diphosphate-sugar epimerase